MSNNQKYARWLQSEFDRTGKKKKNLAVALGLDPAAISKLLVGQRELSAREKEIAERFFQEDTSSSDEIVLVPELSTRAGAGGGGVAFHSLVVTEHQTVEVDGIKDQWGIPASFLRHELRTGPRSARIVEVVGDSMEPTLKPGDRIIVDTDQKQPSPPGVFAIWDGFGVVVKRIELVPRSDPVTVRLISDNKNHQAYEVTLDEAKIIGRVICKISQL